MQNENFENLKVGDYVTVLTGKKYENDINSMLGKTREDGSYKGEVLEIMAMQFPYVILKNHCTCLGKNHRITLDLRECGLMKLHKDYIDAFLVSYKED